MLSRGLQTDTESCRASRKLNIKPPLQPRGHELGGVRCRKQQSGAAAQLDAGHLTWYLGTICGRVYDSHPMSPPAMLAQQTLSSQGYFATAVIPLDAEAIWRGSSETDALARAAVEALVDSGAECVGRCGLLEKPPCA